MSIRFTEGALSSPCLKAGAPRAHLVDVREEGGCIIIEPLSQQLGLDEMLAAITAENVHAAVDFGSAVGKELL
ncbi:PbsX family transcriptional regulator [Acidithiobacillus ferrooxidans]|uniref:AbrB/MazE/SpoVT family DNA-binding domain-containing protein n=1 Tax=Acidithiobacillus ferrooxidans TaxID=920 RepID=UPI001D02FA48|nr:PbsX family transcriptional regulator [Acidithiobacillus ferrooxidans]MBU2774218.1 PbsX family transcriptional regulator [Acidithiobacillus ferrooxidans]